MGASRSVRFLSGLLEKARRPLAYLFAAGLRRSHSFFGNSFRQTLYELRDARKGAPPLRRASVKRYQRKSVL